MGPEGGKTRRQVLVVGGICVLLKDEGLDNIGFVVDSVREKIPRVGDETCYA